MRTIAAVLFVLALGFSFAVISGSGAGAAIFGVDAADAGGIGPMETLNETAKEGVTDEGDVSGDVGTSDESNIVGFITDGASFIVTLVVSVVLLPATLLALGFPHWFAIPFGLVVQIVASVGFVQFVTGRQWI